MLPSQIGVPLLRTSSDQSSLFAHQFEMPSSPRFFNSQRMNSITLESPLMEKKRISRRLSRSNSDAELLNAEENSQGREDDRIESLDRKRRSHSIDEILLSGEEEMEMSLESASNKIEEILGNDNRKFTKSGGRPIFKKGFPHLKRGKSDGKNKKVQRSPSHREEGNHSGTSTPTDQGSCENSPSVSRRKAVIKKMRKSLLLNFNTTEEFENTTADDAGSISSGERLSSSPSNTDIDHTTNNGCVRIKSVRLASQH